MDIGTIISHFFVGLLIIAVGVVSLKYNFQLVGFTGHIGFFERYLGAGSTYLGLKLVSVLMVIFGVLYMTGLSDPLLRWALSPLAIFFTGPKP